MKKYFLWGILIAVVVLALSISGLRFANAESKPAEPKSAESSANAIKIQKIKEYEEKKDFDAAIKAADEYLKSDPKNTEVLIRLARCYKHKKEYSLAKKTIARALKIDTKNFWALRVLAKINREQYEIEKKDNLKRKYLDSAQAAIESSLTYNPQDHVTNAEAALIYFYKKDKVRATQAIDLALKVEPDMEHYKASKEKIQSMP